MVSAGVAVPVPPGKPRLPAQVLSDSKSLFRRCGAMPPKSGSGPASSFGRRKLEDTHGECPAAPVPLGRGCGFQAEQPRLLPVGQFGKIKMFSGRIPLHLK